MLHLSNLQFFSAEIAGIISGICALWNQIIRCAVAAAADFFALGNRHPFFIPLACIMRGPVTPGGFNKGTGGGFCVGSFFSWIWPVRNSCFCFLRTGRPTGFLFLCSRLVWHWRLIRRRRRSASYRGRCGSLGSLLFSLSVFLRIQNSAENHNKYNNFKNETKHKYSPRLE